MLETKCDMCKTKFDNKEVGGLLASKSPFAGFERKIRARRFLFSKKYKGNMSTSEWIDGFPEAIITKWKDFDLCEDCSELILKMLLGQVKIKHNKNSTTLSPKH
jgi:hypothetical protein